MNKRQDQMRAAGIFFVRVLLGIIFLMQGYGKVFTLGIGKIYDLFFKVFEQSFLPKWLIILTVYYTSYIEFACGLLLIVGLFRKYASFLLAIDLLIVSFGHGLMEPIWDLSHVIPRAVLLAALFLVPETWDKWNLDVAIWRDKND